MPTTRFQVALHAESNLPEDDHVNVLYFDTDDISGTADDIGQKYEDHQGIFNSWWNQGLTVKAYPLGGGQPVETADHAFVGQGGQGPTEVAICLSYAAVDDPDVSTPRRRGRIYLGTPGGGTRPSGAQIQAIQDFGIDLATVGIGSAQTWMLYSPTDNVAVPIESIYVDDAWDTQRRRGRAPSQRFVSDVQ